MTTDISLDITLKDIYPLLCSKCKKRLEKLVKKQFKKKLTDNLVEQALGKVLKG